MIERGEQRERETLRQQRADSNHSADKNVTHSRKQLQLRACHKAWGIKREGRGRKEEQMRE